MTDKMKGILIWGIINKLNECVIRENKKLCETNLFDQQKPLHGGEMFFKLAFLDDSAIEQISSACGL